MTFPACVYLVPLVAAFVAIVCSFWFEFREDYGKASGCFFISCAILAAMTFAAYAEHLYLRHLSALGAS